MYCSALGAILLTSVNYRVELPAHLDLDRHQLYVVFAGIHPSMMSGFHTVLSSSARSKDPSHGHRQKRAEWRICRQVLSV